MKIRAPNTIERFIALLLCICMLLPMTTSFVTATSDMVDAHPPDIADTNKDSNEINFSSCRLLVRTDDIFIFTEDTEILADYDGVYLVGFESEQLTEQMYYHYKETADFVDPDITFNVADESYTTEDDSTHNTNNSFTRLNILRDALSEKYGNTSGWERPSIALIDTGVSADNVDGVSVIGDTVADDNGHGDAMLDVIRDIDKDLSILSIKAFDKTGYSSLSNIYAAIEYAILIQADVICLPFSGENSVNISSLSYLVEKAKMANIIVVASAGNNGHNVTKYVPACVDGIYVAGACDEDGKRLSTSNYGSNIFCNIVAESTSEAAAKLSAFVAMWDIDRVKFEFDNGIIFKPDTNDADTPDEIDTVITDDGQEISLVEVDETPDNALLTTDALSDTIIAAINATASTNATREPPKNEYPIQDPVTVDGQTIERVTVRWLTCSDNVLTEPAGFGRLALIPYDSNVTNQQFQIDFSLSGQGSYEPGSIQISFPAYLWLNRNNKEPGELTLSVPEDPDSSAEFAWKRIDNTIVLTNTKSMSAASKVLIQGTFRDVYAPDMKDGSLSDMFSVVLSVTTPSGKEMSMESNWIDATINTSVEVSTAKKIAYDSVQNKYTVYWATPSDIPSTLLPANVNDYVYVRWYISGSAVGSQPFVMTVTDTVTNQYGGIMLGASGTLDGTVKSTDNKTVTARLYNGYSTTEKTAYIWTAYRKDTFSTNVATTLSNTATISVTGWDGTTPSTKSASATVNTKVPTTYTFVKRWDDDNDKRGLRQSSLKLYIYDDAYSNKNPWRTVTLTKAMAKNGTNDWTYTWTDEGETGHSYSVKEDEAHLASGTHETRFDGYGHSLIWNYLLESTHYDSSSHTWTYVNKYYEGWIKFEISQIKKKVQSPYNDNTQDSLRDALSLNRLRRGETIYIPYDVTSEISVALESVWHNVKPNLFVLEDEEYQLNGKAVSVNDIDVGYVILTEPSVWKYVNLDMDTGYYERELVTAPTMTLYGYIGGAWKAMATMTNGNVTAVANSGATVKGMRVDLPEGVSKVKTELQSDAAIVDMSYTVALRIHPSSTIQNMITQSFDASTYAMYTLYNKATGYAVYQGSSAITVDGTTYRNGDVVETKTSVDTGYLHGRSYRVAADLNKTFAVSYNDTSNRRTQLHSTITLTQQSNITSSSEYVDAVKLGEIPNTRSGIYYDLLPLAVDVDMNSIKLSDGDRVSNAYVIPNYKGSGRTLLVVYVTFTDHASYTTSDNAPYAPSTNWPQEGYKNVHTIEFDMYISWDAAPQNTWSSLRNVSAYRADEGEIGSIRTWEGEPDNPFAGNNRRSSEAVGTDGTLMTNLYSGDNKPAFVYAGSMLTYTNVEIMARTSLWKYVQATGAGLWSSGLKNDVNVQESGSYVYNLFLRSAADTTTKDIIILDSLENYRPTIDDEDYGDVQWHGSFMGIDVSQMIAAGINPTIYYSTVPDLDLSAIRYNPQHEAGAVKKHLIEDTYNGSPVWSTTPPVDLSKVTAIAIDASMGKDGKPFELKEGEMLSAYLYMQAPFDTTTSTPFYFKNTDGTDYLLNAHAYNNVYLDCAQTTPDGNTRDYINYSYTKVGIYTKNLTVKKEWHDENDNDGIRPSSVKVTLVENGQLTTKSITLSEPNWSGSFDRVKSYDDEGNPIIYSLYEETNDTYTPSVETRTEGNQTTLILINTHEPETTDIEIEKLWDDDDDAYGVRPEFIVLRLFANDEDTGLTITIYPDENDNWYGAFTDVKKYYNGGEPIVYTLREETTEDYKSTIEGFKITNHYSTLGDLTIKKTTKNATPQAVDAEFTFDFFLSVDDETPDINKYNYTIYNADNTESSTGTIGNGNSFTLTDGQYIVIKDIPTHLKYKVTENATPGFKQTSALHSTGIIVARGTTVEFVNTYSSKGSAELIVGKELTGRTLQRYQFRFELRDATGKLIKTAYNDADGTVSFGRINYTDIDNGIPVIYSVAEVIANRKGYTYDNTIYTIQVTPRDQGDGTMTADIVYLDSSGHASSDRPTFHNSYHAEGKIGFKAWKDFAGELTANLFKFELYDGQFNLLQTVGNDANGVIQFSEINFNETHIGNTYFYFIHELQGTDATVKYDDTILLYAVEVVDNGDGTLSFKQSAYDATELFETCSTCDGTGIRSGSTKCSTCLGLGHLLTASEFELTDAVTPIFNNGLADGSLSVTKWTTNGDTAQSFKFRVTLIGKDLNNADIQYEISKVVETTNALSTNVSSDTPSSINATLDDEYAIMPMLAPDATIIRDGHPGGNLYWALYSDGTLLLRPDSSDSNYTSLNSSSPYQTWPWYNFREQIYRVEVQGSISLIGNVGCLFLGCTNLVDIQDLAKLDTSQLTSMWQMFDGCSNLSDVSALAEWDMSGVGDYYYAFRDCTSLVDISPLSEWRATYGAALSGIFSGCSNLAVADFSNWNTGVPPTAPPSTAWHGLGAFTGCTKLAQVTIGPDFFATDYVFTLPTPPSDITTGKWVLIENADDPDADAYSSSDLRTALRNNPSLAGTYVWQYKAPYTVTFDSNGGAGSMLPVVYTSVTALTLPSCSFVRPHYKFAGWKDEANGWTYTPNASGDIIIPANRYGEGDKVTLVAQWEQNLSSADFSEGYFEFELHGGEEAYFVNVPAGTAYQVWEDTPSGWVLVEQVNASGVIQPLTESKAEFTNDYQAGVVTVNLVGTKLFDGEASATDAKNNPFRFQLLNSSGTVIETVSAQAGGFIQFESLKFTSAGTYQYTIREVAGSNTDIQYDSHSESITITVTGSSSSIKASVTYDADGIVFENKTKPGTLEISKTSNDVTNANKNATFHFSITFYNENGIPMDASSFNWHVKDTATGTVVTNSFFETIDNTIVNAFSATPTFVTDTWRRAISWLSDRINAGSAPEQYEIAGGIATIASNGNSTPNSLIVSCKIGQTVVISDLPAGTTYEIEEIDLPDGWSFATGTGLNGSISISQTSSATIRNSYSAKGYASITAHKTLDGAQLTSGRFSFSLYDQMPANTTTPIQTVTNGPLDDMRDITDDGGNITPNQWYGTAPIIFDVLEFNTPGTYTYYIREVIGNDDVLYDEHTEIVTITATDNGNGSLKCDVKYDDDGPVFENLSYGSIKIIKTATNGGTVEGWQFTVYADSDCTTVATDCDNLKLEYIKTDATGNILIERIMPGTYYIKEVGCPTGHTEYYWNDLPTAYKTVTVNAGDTESVQFDNNWYGRININKTLENPEAGTLSGWKFMIYTDSACTQVAKLWDGTPSGTLTTDSAGKIITERLEPGTYYVKEILDNPSYWYSVSSNPQTVIVTAGETANVSFDNALRSGSISVYKTDANGNVLSDVTFLLEYSEDDGNTWNPVTYTTSAYVRVGTCTSSGLMDGTLTTGSDGTVTFTGLYPLHMYRLTEVSTQSGYQLLTDVVFEGTLSLDKNLAESFHVINHHANDIINTGTMDIIWYISTCVFALLAVGIIFKKRRNTNNI